MQPSAKNDGASRAADILVSNIAGVSEAPRNGNTPGKPQIPRMLNLMELLRERCTHLPRPSSMRIEWLAPDLADYEVLSEPALLICLIVKEAVANAIRYSHPAGVTGIIKIACGRNHDGALSVEVRDDGVGLPEDFDPAQDGGPGLQLIYATALRLGARLEFESTSLGLSLLLLVPRNSIEACGAALTLVKNGKEIGSANGGEENQNALDASVSQRLAAIVESCDDAILSKDLNGIIKSWNTGAQRLFGYSAEEMIGKSVMILIPEDRRGEEPEIIARIRRGERVNHYETVRLRKDGSLVEISLSVSPIKDANGTVVGASKIAHDISEHKKAQARQEFLTREINHRTKNLFAIIQAVVNRSFVGKTSIAEAKAAILGRLSSLAQTNVLLMEADFKGADIADIVRTEMSPYHDRAEIEGPHFILSSQAAQNIALAVHELATNAAKYGALCTPSGSVSVNWRLIDEEGRPFFLFGWRERGGPPVTAPQRKGFGSTVLEHVMAEYFETRIDFAPSGIVYELKGAFDGIAG
jgi:PAS domain S-box-containing protein